MKKIVIRIITFLLTILLILATILTVYSSTINNKNYLLKILEETGFYSELKNSIDEHFQKYVLQSGLPEDIFTNLISGDFVKDIVNTNIDNFYSYVYNQSSVLEISVDTTNLQNELRTRIDKFVNENSMTLTQDEQKGIDDYINIVFEPFSLNSVINNGISTAANYLNKINSLYRIAMGCTIIFVSILLVLLFMICKNFIYNLIYILSIILSSAIILRVFSEILIRNKIINDFYILSLYFSNTIINYIQGIFNILIWFTNIVFIVIGFVLLIVVFSRKKL